MIKKLLFVLALLTTIIQGFSQTKGISYQAVILNPNNQSDILVNKAISIQFTIVNVVGAEEYQETHDTSTDRYGMINLLIGDGLPKIGSFTNIVWDGTTKKLNVVIDFEGGSNYTPLSEQNLSYVPQPANNETIQLITDTATAIQVEVDLNTAKEGITTAQATTISNTTGVNTGDQDISGIATNATAISVIETGQTTQNSAIGLNTAKSGITAAQATTISNTTGVNTGDQDISGIATNATAISVIETGQTTQNSAIGLNTAKSGITAAQATTISNTTGVNTGDQDISGIATNATAISVIETDQTTQNSAIALNTAKEGITAAQATTINNTTGVNTGDQDISGIATNATAISVIETDQTTQNSAIALNTAKEGITTAQATTINNTTGVNTGDQDISGIATNATAISVIETDQTTQNSAIALNTAKEGITAAQATTINNTTGLNTGDQDISGIATNATAISVIETDQTTQNSAIALNTAKEGITTAQATTINNTTGVNTGDQDISGIATNATAISVIETDQITQNSAIGLNTAKVGITTTQLNAIVAIRALADGSIYLGDSNGQAKEVTLSGDVTVSNAGVTAIGASKVQTGMLADDAITTSKIANKAITDVKIATVKGSKIIGDISGNADNVIGTVAVTNGGTGANTAAGARTNLGLGSAALNNTSDFEVPLTVSSPMVRINNVIDIPSANASVNGYLNAEDFIKFSNKIDITEKAATNGVATLGPDGKIPSYQIPAISFQSASVVDSEGNMLAISNAQVGSIAIRTDVDKNFVLSSLPASIPINWLELSTPTAITSVNGNYGPNVSLTKSDLVLGNVDNTTDVNKPVSTATQTVLDGKVDTGQVLTNVPSGALFTDTVYNDIAIQAEVDLNTAKSGITAAQATVISKTTGVNTGDQDISGIATNAGAVSTIQEAQTTQNTAIGLNTAKEGITSQQASNIISNTAKSGITAAQATTISNTTGVNKGDQDISGIATNATAISVIETDQTIQNSAIGLNTAKSGITTAQATVISKTTGVNTGDQDISGIATNAGAVSTIQEAQTTQNTAIGLNTAKEGITSQQASNIISNTAKSGITAAQATTISNTTGVNKGDQDISGIATNAGAVSTIQEAQTTQNTAIGLNTAKEGITSQQASNIISNTAKSGITAAQATTISNTTGVNKGDQDISGIATNATAISVIETDQTIQNSAIGLNTAKSGITAAQATTISNTTGVNAGDQDISGIATNAGAVSTIQEAQTTQNTAIGLNTAKEGITSQQASNIISNTAKSGITTAQATTISKTTGVNTGDQDISGIATNAGAVSTIQEAQTIQNSAIGLNTAKSGITAAQATTISNTTGVNKGDQDISGIATNAGAVSTIQEAQTTQNTAIGLNTAKSGITTAQATTISNTTGVNTGDQDISGIATNATAISVIETDQTTQNTAIGLNTAKSGITTAQATTISNTTGVNTGDQDISGIATNAGDISTIQEAQTTQNTAIGLNTAKEGITSQQASNIISNTAKSGITAAQSQSIADNIVDIGDAFTKILANETDISTNEGGISTLIGGQNTQNLAIALNTAKDISGITANATAIANKQDKVGHGNAYEVLTTDGAGVLAWSSSASYGGLISFTEGTNTGYRRADAVAANYGDIGNGAVDFSFSNIISTAYGATGSYALASGHSTTASGDYSSAFGEKTVALGKYATAMGYNTFAKSEASTAMGAYTIAEGFIATAMGSNTLAAGHYSTSMGGDTKAIGIGSTAMGEATVAAGNHSTSMGEFTVASGDNTTTMGYGTIASDYGSLVLGQYNSAGATVTSNATSYAVSNTAFVIGNGTAGDSKARSDAFKVLFNGNTTMAGTLTIGAITLPNIDGNANEVLTTDGAGVLAWSVPASVSIADNSVTTAKIDNGTIDEIDLDTSVNKSLELANSALQSFDEVDGSRTNEIQSLSIEGSALTLSDSNTITIPSGTDDQTATEVSITDSASLITATTVEGALVENRTAIDAKAPIANPTFTGTVGGITKAMVALGSVDNTTDADKPISTATQAALDAKATAGLARFPTNTIVGYPDGDGFRRADATTANYGNLGAYAIDLSISDGATDNNGATGFAAMATGYNSLAAGAMATAMGKSTTASGDGATAMGSSTKATAKNAIAMGETTEATAQNATAMGNSTKAIATGATAMGNTTLASGSNSTAMGYETQATGEHATAMGYETKATFNSATAMGRKTLANGDNSTAMGRETEASGSNSTAMGQYTEATAQNATAMGFGTTASDYGSVVIGQYNSAGATITSSAGSYAADNTAFVIGNGTDDDKNKSDAFKVLFNGNTTMAGTLTLGAITIPNTDGDAYEVLTTDGAGVLAWSALASGSITDNSVTTNKIADATIDEVDLDASVNSSLDLADSALQSFTEVDGSRTNEIQSLSIEGSALTLSDSNTITIPSGTDDQTATEVAITDNDALITATTVEGALVENRTAIDANENAIRAVEDNLDASVANIANAINTETSTARAAEGTLTANVATNATAITAIKPTTSGTAGQVLTMNADATPIPVWEKPAASGGLLSITEDSKIGYRRADAVAANYGDIGQDAIDLSISKAPSVFGATGSAAIAMGHNTNASGIASTVMGEFTTASGHASTAMGRKTLANGDNSTAMGNDTKASGYNATAMGFGTTASDYGSVVIGQYNSAGATITSSAGSYAADNTAFVIGNGTDDGENKSDAFKVLFNGNTTAAGTVTANAFVGDGSGLTNLPASYEGLQSVTENSKTGYRRADANADNYGDIGQGAIDLSISDSPSSIFGATGTAAIAMGRNTTAKGIYSTAMGNGAKASGTNSTAMGYSTEAIGIASAAMGSETEASGHVSIAMGFKTEASGNVSIAMGTRTIASDYGSVVIGQYNSAGATITSSATSYAADNTAFVIGNGTDDGENKSDAFKVLFNGNTTAAGTVTANAFVGDGSGLTNLPASYEGLQSVTENSKTGYRRADANADNYGDIGQGAIDLSISDSPSSIFGATGTAAIAMGRNTTAKGIYSTAMGNGAKASGTNSTAMGYSTEAIGIASAAMGSETEASGHVSIAMGFKTEASGNVSIAMGTRTIASDYGSVVIGQYNLAGAIATSSATSYAADNTAFVIGNGTDDGENKSDAFKVLFNGNTTAAGTVTANAFVGDGSGLTNLPASYEGLQSVTENSKTGYRRADANADNYGDIGQGAIDLSISEAPSSTFGATGSAAIAMGSNIKASEMGAIAIGSSLIANTVSEMVIGRFNEPSEESNSTWTEDDPLFTIGNGSELDEEGLSGRNNAFQVLKNGDTYINGDVNIGGTKITKYAVTAASFHGDGSYLTDITVEDNAITSAKIENGTIVGEDIADDAITSAKIENGTIVGEDIADDAITSAKIENGTIVGEDIADDAAIAQSKIAGLTDALASAGGAFSTVSNVTSNSGGTLATDDFVFGSSQLNDDASTIDDDSRFLFDKEMGAFRAGTNTTNSWDKAHSGRNSVAMGYNTTAGGEGAVAIGTASNKTGSGAQLLGPNASGKGAIAMGLSTQASKEGAVALGILTIASGAGALAYGEETQAIGLNSMAGGYESISTGIESIALGNTANATGANSVAMGYNTTAGAEGAVAIGTASDKLGAGTETLGPNASGKGAIAMGLSTIASGNGAYAFGSESEASGLNSMAGGFLSKSTGANSVAIGTYITANTIGEVALGRYNTPASANNNWNGPDPLFTIGNGSSSVSTKNAFQILKNGDTTIDGKLTVGAITLPIIDGDAKDVLTTDGAGVLGWSAPGSAATEVSITDSDSLITATTVEGALVENRTAIDANENAIAAIKPAISGTAGQVLTMNADATPIPVWEKPAASGGLLSITEGVDSNMGYRRADANAANYGDIGQGAIDLSISDSPSSIIGATGTAAIAMGRNTTATGIYSTAMGWDTKASGFYSTAMGHRTEAIGIASAAMGSETAAKGQSSVAMGFRTKAIGNNATAMGSFTEAIGENATAMGTNTITSDYGSVVIGQYNLAGAIATSSATSYAAENTAFVIGNGTGPGLESDAFKVFFNGNTTAAGTVTANAFVGDGSGLTNVTASAIADNAITSAKISNGAILNEDISSSAAIDLSKISGLTDALTSLIDALSGKQNTITDDGLTIAQTNGLQDVLDAKAPIDNPIFTGQTVTVNNDIKATRYVLTAPDAITASSTTTIDLSTGNVITISLSAATTLTTSNADVGTYLVKLVQNSSGNHTVSFPAAWKWSGGSAPTVTPTAYKTDIVTLIYDGSTFYAAISQNF